MEKIYIISRDGKPVGIVREHSETGPLGWFHREHSASMAHALEHEGYSIAEGEPDCGDVADILEGIAARLGLTMVAEFVPFSQSRNAKPDSGFGDGKPWQSLNWRITLKRSGRAFLLTDYGQGVAYAPASKVAPRGGRSMSGPLTDTLRQRAIAAEIETGTRHDFGDSMMMSVQGIRDTRKPIEPPRLGDVLQSLASDSRVLDEGTFEQWAEGLGYDPDSRKAEGIWKACVETATALRGALGARTLEELQLAAEFN